MKRSNIDTEQKIIIMILMISCLLLVGVWRIWGSNTVITDDNTPLAGNIPVSVATLLKTHSDINYLEDCDFSITNWISGEYAFKTGIYKANPERICLNEYKEINSYSYKVNIQTPQGSYIVKLAEYDDKGNYLRDNYVVNGMTYTPKTEVKYVGVTVYEFIPTKNCSFATYKTAFNNGLKISLTSNGLINKPIKDVITTPEKGATGDNPIEIEEKSNKTIFKDELKNMIITGDLTTHDVLELKVSFRDALDAWNELADGELRRYIKGDNIYIAATQNKAKTYVSTLAIMSMDKDFVARFNRMEKTLDEIYAGMDDKMSDLDKILYVHEFLVKNTTYTKVGEKVGTASSILGDRKGLCNGYGNALILVLRELGIETYLVASTPMNHSWNYVVLDGETYHIDVCRDKTQMTTNTGANWHRLLLRSDAEIETIQPTHYGYSCPENKTIKATSEKYKNWFVHDVNGQMFYYEGLWYYYETKTKSIVCSDVYGNNRKIIIDGSKNTVKLIKMDGNKISYTIDGVAKTKTI